MTEMIVKTASGALKLLWEAKFFFKPKTVGEIKIELESRGYNFTDANVGMNLKTSKFLTRKGSFGDYRYVQKHPFVEDDRNNN